eukprot:s3557_g1.t1
MFQVIHGSPRVILGTESASRAAYVSSDPWQSQGDPWSTSAPRDDDRWGGSDKISVPDFSGEDDKDGMITRGYLRKVAAWRRMTRLRPNKQALALYNSLTGRAWRDAEELDLALLDSADGVDVFTRWISEKYLDKEDKKGSHHAHVTENADGEEAEDGDMTEDEEETFPESDEETQEAFVSFQNAKSKYQSLLKSRGASQASSKDKEERIRQAKARSYCSACKRRGHWHKDPECPLYKGNKNGAQPSQVSHVCEVFHAGCADSAEVMAITDCAFIRTVAGSEWIKRLRENALAKGHRFEIVLQHEHFKFGGDKLFLSKKAWCFWMNIQG